MGAVISMDLASISDAVIIWTGWKTHAWPIRDDDRIISAFGPELGPQIVAEVHALEADFCSSRARLTVSDLVEMGEQAANEFGRRNPKVSEEAVQALKWCYTFDYK